MYLKPKVNSDFALPTFKISSYTSKNSGGRDEGGVVSEALSLSWFYLMPA